MSATVDPDRYYIALGSNRWLGRYGPPAQVLVAALEALDMCPEISIKARSRLFRTPPMGPPQPHYVNAVIELSCTLLPPDLLAVLKRTEQGFGRVAGRRWGPRVLDLDIIGWSGGCWPRCRGFGPHALAVPHPRAHQRVFVLAPLCDVAAAWRHPRLNRTARQLRHRLPRGGCKVMHWPD